MYEGENWARVSLGWRQELLRTGFGGIISLPPLPPDVQFSVFRPSIQKKFIFHNLVGILIFLLRSCEIGRVAAGVGSPTEAWREIQIIFIHNLTWAAMGSLVRSKKTKLWLGGALTDINAGDSVAEKKQSKLVFYIVETWFEDHNQNPMSGWPQPRADTSKDSSTRWIYFTMNGSDHYVRIVHIQYW